MFLPMFRVVVVAAFVCVLTVAAVPTYAVPLGDGQAVEKAESDWFQVAFAWLQGVFGTNDPAVPESEVSIPLELMNGSCIDPFGGGGWCG
jgi:hypothetical protein